MPIVSTLVAAHLAATAVLLAVFALVVVCQWVARAFERPADSVPGPVEAVPEPTPGHVPVQTGAPAATSGAGVSVLDWSIDLRDPRVVGAELQTS